ncbi:polysaccharide synthesis protein GtrA [Nocardioides sp. Root190]|nr:polysaccharide synthesis protein GtrA [Nocardioides sp. Root190]
MSMLPELGKFGVVGLVGLLVDVGGFNLLRFAGGEGPLHDYPLTAKIVSSAVATIVSWLGHRYWTFEHGRRDAVHHEFLLFLVMCTIGTGIAVGCLAVSHYVLGFESAVADNIAANVIGLGLGTAFRFWAYRTVVFSHTGDGDGASGDSGSSEGSVSARA